MSSPESLPDRSGFTGPMLATRYYRRTGYVMIGGGLAIGFAVLTLHLVAPLDAFGIGIGLSLAAIFVLRGLWRLRSAARSHPESVVHQTLATAPPDLQRAWLRRWIPLGALGFVVLTAMNVHDLLDLERGNADSVRVWAPVALIYDAFGFWPAATCVPIVGALTLVALVRRLRRIQSQRAQ